MDKEKLIDKIKNLQGLTNDEKADTQANLAKNISLVHEYIFVYAKNIEKVSINRVPYSKEFIAKTFKNPDNDPKGSYQTGPLARPIRC